MDPDSLNGRLTRNEYEYIGPLSTVDQKTCNDRFFEGTLTNSELMMLCNLQPPNADNN